MVNATMDASGYSFKCFTNLCLEPKVKRMISKIYRKKQQEKSMNKAMAMGNRLKSKIQEKVEYMFAMLKDKMYLFIRIIGFKKSRDQNCSSTFGL
jgi:hypothetical protein